MAAADDNDDVAQHQNEEQEMEAEALEAIFDHHFSRVGPQEWSVELFPELAAPGEECDESTNHVACRLNVKLPPDYPEDGGGLPGFEVAVVKGLAVEHVDVLEGLARDEAEANEGAPCVFAVCERLREWLMDNNVKGLDDRSMYSQMMRKQQQEQKSKEQREQLAFEAQTHEEQMTEAELEEMTVRKRREEGTPCNDENFERWRAEFEKEMAERAALAEKQDEGNVSGGKSSKKAGCGKEKKVDKTGRLTGYQQFSNTASMNLEALEAAAELAEQEEMDEDELEDVDEDLFEDDVDLDDLDFDDDDEDDDEEDIDI